MHYNIISQNIVFLHIKIIFFQWMGKLQLVVVNMLGERLKDIRDEFTLKQEEMAKILDVSQSNYSRWENDT